MKHVMPTDSRELYSFLYEERDLRLLEALTDIVSAETEDERREAIEWGAGLLARYKQEIDALEHDLGPDGPRSQDDEIDRDFGTG
jgi:hypothetical protein